MQIAHSPARRRPESSGQGRARLSRAERGAVQVAAVAVAGFCIYGFATGSPSTVGYASAVIVIGAAMVLLRRAALPGLLAAGLAIAAIATLAGGLINVGQEVLYNASIGPYSKTLGTHFLQYDHLAQRLCELRRRVRLLGHARRAPCGRGSPPRTGDLGRERRAGAGRAQ
jgi:hypothetical protein